MKNEPKRYQPQAFPGRDLPGVRRFKELVEILKSCGFVDSYRSSKASAWTPRESNLVKAVSIRLEELEGAA